MTPLTANLKIFYQRKGLWFWYLILLAQGPVIAMSYHKEEFFNRMHYLIIPMLMGMMVGTLQKEIMSRPITFCLPDGRKLYRHIIYGIGALLSLVLTLLYVPLIHSSGIEFILITLALMFINLSVYLFSAQFSYQDSTPNRFSWLGPIWAFLFLTIFFGGYFHIWNLIHQIHWLFIVTLGGYCYYGWTFFNPEKYTRQFCGRALPGLSGNWTDPAMMRQQVAEFYARKKPDEGRMSRYEQLTLNMMRNRTLHPTIRHSAGSVYAVIGSAFARGTKQFIFGIMILIVIYGYIMNNFQVGKNDFGQIQTNIIYVMPVFGAMMWILPVHPSLLMPFSRKKRFAASLIAMVTITIITTGLMTSMVAVANLAEPYMPVLPWFGEQGAVFTAPYLTNFYLTPMFMPLGFATGTLFGRRNAVMMFIGPLMFLLAMALSAINTLLLAQWYYIVICVLASWIIFTLVLYRHCLKGNLVGPNRT